VIDPHAILWRTVIRNKYAEMCQYNYVTRRYQPIDPQRSDLIYVVSEECRYVAPTLLVPRVPEKPTWQGAKHDFEFSIELLIGSLPSSFRGFHNPTAPTNSLGLG
jgi:hypothetical protein